MRFTRYIKWDNADLLAWWRQYGCAAQATFYPATRRMRNAVRRVMVMRGLPTPERRSEADAKAFREAHMAQRIWAARQKSIAREEAADEMYQIRTFGTCG